MNNDVKIFRGAPPRTESAIVANFLEQTFDILRVESLSYTGTSLGSGLEVFDANTLYLALSLTFGGVQLAQVAPGRIQLFNELDAFYFITANQSVAWDTVLGVEKFTINQLNLRDVWFSKIIDSIYAHIIFNGYKITI